MRKYICLSLMVIIITSCIITTPTPTLPSIRPIDLLLSSEDMPVDWKSSEAFSDQYDDWCYIDCAIIQFSPVEENRVYAEQSIYVYHTLEEAKRNYIEELVPSQSGTTPRDWSYESDVAAQSNFACYTRKDVSFPSCTWIAQYGKYLVEFYAELLPDRMSLNDLEKVIHRINLKMRVVANQS